MGIVENACHTCLFDTLSEKDCRACDLETMPWAPGPLPTREGEAQIMHQFAGGSEEHDDRGDLVVAGGEEGARDVSKAKDFQEELVERIISRMPFPSLFKARLFSRAWYFKFPLPSQHVRSLWLSFQDHVASASAKWPTFCPFYVSEDGILGFDRGSNQWKAMLTLSYIPVTLWSSVTVGGSLICVVSKTDLGCNIFVTNVVTGSWRKLPNRPHPNAPDHVRLLPMGSDVYRVLLVHRRTRDENVLYTQVYDSKLKIWTVKAPVVVDLHSFFANSAYLEGKLYCMCKDSFKDPLQVWTYDIEENSWIAIPHGMPPRSILEGAMLLCRDKVMFAVWLQTEPDAMSKENVRKLPGLYTLKNSIGIYELNRSTLHLQLIDTGPPVVTVGVGLWRDQVEFASDADFIYIGQAIPGTPVLTFNVHSHQWTCLPPASYSLGSLNKKIWADFAFEPGLNPFAMA